MIDDWVFLGAPRFGSDIIISRNKSKPLLVQYPHEKKQFLSELLF